MGQDKEKVFLKNILWELKIDDMAWAAARRWEESIRREHCDPTAVRIKAVAQSYSLLLDLENKLPKYCGEIM